MTLRHRGIIELVRASTELDQQERALLGAGLESIEYEHILGWIYDAGLVCQSWEASKKDG